MIEGLLHELIRAHCHLENEIQRRFTADASHELRSPLSRLRAELEVTLRRRRTVPEYEETLRSCLGEVQRVQSLTEELLELARIDAREEPEMALPVAVSEIIAAAVSAVTPEAERGGVLVMAECQPDMSVNAAPVAAKVALANIIDNAVKFSPPGGDGRLPSRPAQTRRSSPLRMQGRASHQRMFRRCSSASIAARPLARPTSWASAAVWRSHGHLSNAKRDGSG
jgi:two-component system OmpR family sensor kinase